MTDIDCMALLDKTLIMYDDLREFKRMSLDRKLEKFNELKRNREIYKENCMIKERNREDGIYHLGQFDIAMCKIAASLFYEKEEAKLERNYEIKSIIEYFTQDEIDSVIALDYYSNIENMAPNEIANAIYSKQGEIYIIINEWFGTQNERFLDLVNRNYGEQGNALVSILKALYTNRFKRISEGVIEYIRSHPDAAGKIFMEYGDVINQIQETNVKTQTISESVENVLVNYSDADRNVAISKLSSNLSELEAQINLLLTSSSKTKDPKSKLLLETQLNELSLSKDKILVEKRKLLEKDILSEMKSENPSKQEFLKSLKGISKQDIRSDTMRFTGRLRKNIEFALENNPEFKIRTHKNEVITVKSSKDWSVKSYPFDILYAPESDIPPYGTFISYTFKNRHFIGSDLKLILKAVYYVHSTALYREGEDTHPMNVNDFVEAFETLRDGDGTSEVIVFASPVGFSEDLLSYINPKDGKNSFSQTNVSIVLIDLKKSSVLYNPADSLASSFSSLFEFETPDEKIKRIKDCIDELSMSTDTCHILEISERVSSPLEEVMIILRELQSRGYGQIIRPKNVDSGNIDSVMFSVNKERGK